MMLTLWSSRYPVLMAITAREQAERITAAPAVRALATGILAVFTAIGWAAGRFCVTLAAVFFAAGWLAGLCARAVVYGFQTGAGLSSPAKAPPEPGAR